MRKMILLSITVVPQMIVAADGRILANAAEQLSRVLQQTICKTLRPTEATCRVSIESATHHQLGNGHSLWAIAWKANTAFRLQKEGENAMRDALEKLQAQILDIYPDYFTGITYFRQQGRALEQLNGAAFSMAALNTTHKAVARIAPELFLAGDVQYVLPQKWQNEGLRAKDRETVKLTIPALATELAVSLRDLDDGLLSGVGIESCRLQTAGKERDCNPGQIIPPSQSSSLILQLLADKKLKTSQPAFKLVLQEARSGKLLLHLAIPYRPRPNYMVFGVAGFLFGGLIAVMVLFLRKKPPSSAGI
ncbi:MAG: hypothetical protein OHK0011_07540 [Turneriella sp.]